MKKFAVASFEIRLFAQNDDAKMAKRRWTTMKAVHIAAALRAGGGGI